MAVYGDTPADKAAMPMYSLYEMPMYTPQLAAASLAAGLNGGTFSHVRAIQDTTSPPVCCARGAGWGWDSQRGRLEGI